MPSLPPPDDWDFTIHNLRLVVDERALDAAEDRLAVVTQMLYEGTVELARYEHGVWQVLGVWPAFQLSCGGVACVTDEGKPVPPDTRAHALFAPQPVRAARTRVTFPGPAYIFVDGMDRGSDLLVPVWSKRSPFLLSTARHVKPEVPGDV